MRVRSGWLGRRARSGLGRWALAALAAAVMLSLGAVTVQSVVASVDRTFAASHDDADARDFGAPLSEEDDELDAEVLAPVALVVVPTASRVASCEWLDPRARAHERDLAPPERPPSTDA